LSLLHHRVAQHAQPLNLDDVAGLEEDGRLAGEADARRRAFAAAMLRGGIGSG
jgi:hypothetical protein